ncbi:predicted protein [Phaeodactylum tricornutum CCAP 1055/1]|jgi:hypothetical protein|uniref:DUF6824 domain-containing protein n=2 Tax=Phaeodactylum tricornutum TaxID=2850 RepID=B7G967_PHATC|nr:predicted protein [Phaeodactylum tricornutum CCAP 1055/1]EEC44899.1 predicted protein [Phaeodactylum tricornutum CCAP 1055/1]|eukprot:XP_002183717.1 predicted protein [Phaeodactylum tricornutum CCAP 1055/1]
MFLRQRNESLALVETNKKWASTESMTSKRSGRNTTGSVSDAVFDDPRDNDILCGKDKTFAKHTGNRIFRSLIESNITRYTNSASKQQKMKITKDIVATMQVKNGARFLKQLDNGDWQEITNEAARDKVSHALRFASKSKDERNMANSVRRSKKHHRRNSSNTTFSSACTQDYASSEESLSDDLENCAVLKATVTTPNESKSAVATLFQRQQQILSVLQIESSISPRHPSSACLPDAVVSRENPEFNTLRSVDFDELFDEPLFDDGEFDSIQVSL